MGSDLQELLRDTAPAPTRPLDTGALVRRARRQVLASRVAAGLGGVAMLVTAVLLGPSVAGTEAGLEIADRPDSEHADAERRRGLTVDDLTAELWDRTYVSIEVTEDGTQRELLDGTRIELTLHREPLVRDVDGGQRVDPEADGFAIWVAGCTRNQSQLYVTNGRFEFGGFGYTSLQLCASEEQDAQDRWVDEFFRSGPAWKLDGARLVLSAGEVTIVLRDPDPEAAGGRSPDRWLTADSAEANPAPGPPQFAPPPEVTVEDAPAGTADRFAAAHDLTIERASITRFGDDTAAVDLALRDPTADVGINVMLKQLAAPEPREAWIESATDWDHFRDGDLEILQAVSERFERTVAVTPTGLHVAVTITPPPRQATLPVHVIDTLALATAALDDPILTDLVRGEPG